MLVEEIIFRLNKQWEEKTMGNFDNRNDRPGNGGFGNNFGPREMHTAVCDECKKECEVPFKPTEGKPVFCKECYAKRKPRY
jgi:CxxC-x17-CxxC domain-containing protein